MKNGYGINVFFRLAEAICIVTLVLSAVIVLLEYRELPDVIAIHFDITGQPDGWGGKGTIFALPAVGVFLYTVITFIETKPRLWNVPGGMDVYSYHATRALLQSEKLAMCLIIGYLSVCVAKQLPLHSIFLPITLVITFGPIILYLVKLYRYRKI